MKQHTTCSVTRLWVTAESWEWAKRHIPPLSERASGGRGVGGLWEWSISRKKKAIMPTVNKTQSLKSWYAFRFYSGHSGMFRFAISPCVLCPSKCGLIQLHLLLSLIHGYQVYSNNTWTTRLPINKFMLQIYTFIWLLREPKTMIPRW